MDSQLRSTQTCPPSQQRVTGVMGAQKLVQLLLGSGSSRGKSPRSSQTQSRKASPQVRACPLEPWGRLSYCFHSPLSGPKEMTLQTGCPTVPHCWLERNSCPLWALPARNYLLFLLLRPLAMKRLGSGGVGELQGSSYPIGRAQIHIFPSNLCYPAFCIPCKHLSGGGLLVEE